MWLATTGTNHSTNAASGAAPTSESDMRDTVLVTGGTGFIAGWCIAELLNGGYRVRTTVRNAAKQAAVRAAIALHVTSTDDLMFCVADLTADAGWDAAVAGCAYVLHVASPLGGSASDDANAMVAAARDGTLRVLRAATNAGVKRIVMTSAAATARPGDPTQISDESIWADPDDPQFDAYRRSKILAERAAWDFFASAPRRTEFTTILPGAVFGPVQSKDGWGSVRIIQGLLNGRPPGLPRLGFWVVDVRDLAALHVRAMTAPNAAGERFIGAGAFVWMADIAQALRTGLGERAARVPTRALPDFLVRTFALFVPQLRGLVPMLGRVNALTSEKARRVLGFAPRPAAETVVDCAESLLAPTPAAMSSQTT
jgi:nucleoside-diphosphate-sugar epimerase